MGPRDLGPSQRRRFRLPSPSRTLELGPVRLELRLDSPVAARATLATARWLADPAAQGPATRASRSCRSLGLEDSAPAGPKTSSAERAAAGRWVEGWWARSGGRPWEAWRRRFFAEEPRDGRRRWLCDECRRPRSRGQKLPWLGRLQPPAFHTVEEANEHLRLSHPGAAVFALQLAATPSAVETLTRPAAGKPTAPKRTGRKPTAPKRSRRKPPPIRRRSARRSGQPPTPPPPLPSVDESDADSEQSFDLSQMDAPAAPEQESGRQRPKRLAFQASRSDESELEEPEPGPISGSEASHMDTSEASRMHDSEAGDSVALWDQSIGSSDSSSAETMGQDSSASSRAGVAEALVTSPDEASFEEIDLTCLRSPEPSDDEEPRAAPAVRVKREVLAGEEGGTWPTGSGGAEELWRCPMCEARVAGRKAESHVRVELGYFAFRCGLCPALFADRAQAMLHFRSRFAAHPGAAVGIAEHRDLDLEDRVHHILTTPR